VSLGFRGIGGMFNISHVPTKLDYLSTVQSIYLSICFFVRFFINPPTQEMQWAKVKNEKGGLGASGVCRRFHSISSKYAPVSFSPLSHNSSFKKSKVSRKDEKGRKTNKQIKNVVDVGGAIG
jgi:hypothetical protein